MHRHSPPTACRQLAPPEGVGDLIERIDAHVNLDKVSLAVPIRTFRILPNPFAEGEERYAWLAKDSFNDELFVSIASCVQLHFIVYCGRGRLGRHQSAGAISPKASRVSIRDSAPS